MIQVQRQNVLTLARSMQIFPFDDLPSETWEEAGQDHVPSLLASFGRARYTYNGGQSRVFGLHVWSADGTFSHRGNHTEVMPVHNESPMISLPEPLLQTLATGRLTVVIGDGLSSSGTSPRAQLAADLASAVELGESDCWTAATLLEQRVGRTRLIDRVLSQGHNPSPAHDLYAQLANLPIQTVVSLHPDPFLEATLTGASSPFLPLVSDQDLSTLPLDLSERRLYLLGGSCLSKEGLVLTHRDLQCQLVRLERLARGLRERLDGPLLLLHMDADSAWPALILQAIRHRSTRTSPLFLADDSIPSALSLEGFYCLPYSPATVLQSLAAQVPPPVEAAAPSAASHSPLRRVPYRFLNFFEAEDAPYFFGRAQDTAQVCAEILASPSRVTVLCGRSGVGKTSLVKAAVVPSLELAGRFITAYARLGQHPERALLEAVADRLGLQVPEALGLKDGLEWLFVQEPREQLIVIDQCEEAFFALGGAVLDAFFAELGFCASRHDSTTRFLLVVREDFLGRFSALTRVVPGLLSSVYHLPELSREAAAEAIREPARLCNVPVEEALVEALLDDLSPDTILPAQLQIVCEQLYRYRGEVPALCLSDYRALGGASQILRSYLEQAVELLPEGLEALARELLKALVTSEQTRALLSVEQLTRRLQVPEAEVTTLLHTLIHGHRLVREVGANPVCYELAHESMAPAITAWLDEMEARLRAVQEILDQEVSNAQRFKGIALPMDRLHLIEQYRDQLDITPAAVRVVLSGYLARSEYPHYWINRALQLGADSAHILWQYLVFEPARQGPEALSEALSSHAVTIARLPNVDFPAAVIDALIVQLRRSAGEARTRLLALVEQDSTGAFWPQLLHQHLHKPVTDLLTLLPPSLSSTRLRPILKAYTAFAENDLRHILSMPGSWEPWLLTMLLERSAEGRFMSLILLRLGLLVRQQKLGQDDWQALLCVLNAQWRRRATQPSVLLHLLVEFAPAATTRLLLSPDQEPAHLFTLLSELSPELQQKLSKDLPYAWHLFCETLVKQSQTLLQAHSARNQLYPALLACAPSLSPLGKARLCQLLTGSKYLTTTLARRLNPDGPKQLRLLISSQGFEGRDLELIEPAIEACGGLAALPPRLSQRLGGILEALLSQGGTAAYRAARILATHPDPMRLDKLLEGPPLVLKGTLEGIVRGGLPLPPAQLQKLKLQVSTVQSDPLLIMSLARVLVRSHEKAGLRLAADVVVRSSRAGIAPAWRTVLTEVQHETTTEVLISLLSTRFHELSASILDELARRELPGLRQNPLLLQRLVESFKVLRPQESRRLREVLIQLLPESLDAIVKGSTHPVSSIACSCQIIIAAGSRIPAEKRSMP